MKHVNAGIAFWAIITAVSITPGVSSCAVSVTASREYVDRKTTLHANTNGTGEVVGYYLGTQTGINLQPQGDYARKAELADKIDDENGSANDLEVSGLRIIGQGEQGRMLIIGIPGYEVGTDGDGIYNENSNDRICWVFGQGDTAFATRTDIAPRYDSESQHSYVVGQLVAYGDGGYDMKIYRCTTAHTATEWVAANWTLATVEDVLSALRTALAGKANDADVLHNTRGWLVTNAGVVGMQDPTGKEASFRYIEGIGTFLILNDRSYYAPSRNGTLALTASPATAGNLAALDAQGNPTDSGISTNRIVKTPVYDGQNHEFLDAAVEGSDIYGFKTKDVPHRWRAQRRCVVYMRMAGSGSGQSVVYVHVNDPNAPTDDTSHLLFKHALNGGTGMVVPINLNAGDALDLQVTNNSLSQLQYSVFYTD